MILLSGPDGKIIAKDLRGQAIMSAVAHALGAAAPGTQPAEK